MPTHQALTTSTDAEASQQSSPQLPSIARTFPEQYEQQLQQKVGRIKSLFSGWSMPDLQVFSSPQEHYRMR